MRPIDADTLADYLDNELLNECFSGEEISAEDAVRMALRKVLDTPTLDVAPVAHAHWVEDTDGIKEYVDDCTFFCPNCGYCFITDTPDELPNFCSECGAKMDEEETHENVD